MSETQPLSSGLPPSQQIPEFSTHFINRMIDPGSWDRLITRTSADNLVGVLDGVVVKQSKQQFETPEAAQQSLEYVSRSYGLFKQFLPQYTADTQFQIHGQRIYSIQPLLEGKTTLQLTDEETQDPSLLEPFSDIYRRLFTLYRSEIDATRYIPVENRFILTRINPIGAQAQESRFKPPLRVLRVSNMIVDTDSHKFGIFDFGRWIPWKPEMEESYQRIVQKAQDKFQKYGLLS